MKQTQIINEQSKIIRLQTYLVVALVFVMIGATCNHIAIKNNEGRMPVLVEGDYEYKTKTHISYKENHEVEKPFVSDRFDFLHYTYSIGDALMIVFGLISVMLCISLFVKVRSCERLVND